MNLKIGGNSVGKIMYNGQEFGGSQMLESGTILLLLDGKTDWAKRNLGLDFDWLTSDKSITCKAFGVKKDWKNISQILVEANSGNGRDSRTVIDISELKKGPQQAGYLTVTLEGKELTFTNSSKYIVSLILVEAHNE